MLYDQYFIDDLKNRADLVRIIEPYAPLKKKFNQDTKRQDEKWVESLFWDLSMITPDAQAELQVNGGIFADSVEDQVRMSMRNLLDGLEEAGIGFGNAVASNVYVDNLDEFARMNAVYAKYFGEMPPTRTTVSPLAPVERKRNPSGTFPKLEEVSLVLVK